MFPSISKIVFFDGIRVPLASSQCQWGEGGMISINVSLPPSFAAERILNSTFIYIFHVETGLLSYKRSVYEADTSKSVSLPLDVNYLRTDFVREAARSTVRETFDPWINEPMRQSEGDDLAWESLIDAGAVYSAGGIIEQVGSVASNSQGQHVTFRCRGHELDASILKLIQTIKERGTLTTEERRLLGQDTKREGKPKTLLHGRSRKSFAQNFANALIKEETYAAGVRRIVAQYPALSSKYAYHRFAWNRFGQQIALVENDTSVERLLATKTIKEFLKTQIQRSYTLPLFDAVQKILEVIDYRMFSVPAPAYWPIVPAPKPGVEYEEREEDRKVNLGAGVIIRWGESVKYDPASSPPAGSGSISRSGKTWIYTGPTGEETTLDSTVFGAGRTGGTLSEGQTRIDFKLPLRNAKNQPVLGGGSSLTISTTQARFGLFLPHVDKFEYGKTYNVTGTMDLARASGGLGTNMRPYNRLNFRVTITRPRTKTVRKKVRVPIDIPAQRPERYFPNTYARLNTYVILPKLWWATPPVCNVLVPEMFENIEINMPPITNVTRTVARSSIAKKPSAKTMIDKFSAPNSEDLNTALEDVFEDPVDATNLLKYEYACGPIAQLLPLQHLSKMVSTRAWHRYMRSWTVQKHWDMRLEQRTAKITCKTAYGVVPGAPLLVIRSTESEPLQSLTPEQLLLLGQVRALKSLRKRLARARKALLVHLQRARRIREWVQNLKNLSESLYKDKLIDFVDETTVQERGLWTRTGNSLENVAVGSSFNTVFRTGIEDVRANENKISHAHRPTLPPGAAQRAADIGVSLNQADLGTVRYKESFERLLGKKGAEIWPQGGDESGLGSDTIARLPQPDELDEFDSSLSSRVGGLGGCVRALSADIKMIDTEIDRLLKKVRDLGGGAVKNNINFIGYVRSIAEVQAPAGNAQSWTIMLSHVRFLGEDLDWDGLAGDDVENTVVFGEDGYLDEKYSSQLIGEEVYFPMYGSTSIVDLPWVQEAFEEEVSQPLERTSSLDAIYRKLKHPAVCGKDYTKDKDFGLDATKPDTSYAAQKIVEKYLEVKERSGGSSESVFLWLRELHVRPWMTLPDAFRGFPLGWERNKTTQTHMPTQDYEPWASDGVEYGFGDGEGSNTSTGILLENVPNPPPLGFFATSHIPPHIHNTEAGSSITLSQEAKELLKHGEDLEEYEKDFLIERQRRVLDLLATLQDKTSKRKG